MSAPFFDRAKKEVSMLLTMFWPNAVAEPKEPSFVNSRLVFVMVMVTFTSEGLAEPSVGNQARVRRDPVAPFEGGCGCGGGGGQGGGRWSGGMRG